MNEKSKKDSENIDYAELENARIGYQIAVNLWTYQGNLIWNRFNVMLAANSILVAAIGVLLEENPSSVLSRYFLSRVFFCA